MALVAPRLELSSIISGTGLLERVEGVVPETRPQTAKMANLLPSCFGRAVTIHRLGIRTTLTRSRLVQLFSQFTSTSDPWH